MSQAAARESLRFHFKHGWFNVREQFSDLAGGIAGFLLFPFYIWLIARLWQRFNSYQGHYSYTEILLYLGAAEVFFMTFLRGPLLTRAAGDFSISLARPRSWLATSFSGIFGRCLGSRLVYLAIFVAIMPPLGASPHATWLAAARLTLFLPLLGVVQALINLLFASAQVLWEETSYFVLPVSKVFLALGGVFGPIIDFGEPWRTWLLRLPPSDIFFQPAHYCIRGEFYGLSASAWVVRVSLTCLLLAVACYFGHAYARKHHQSYGG